MLQIVLNFLYHKDFSLESFRLYRTRKVGKRETHGQRQGSRLGQVHGKILLERYRLGLPAVVGSL